MRAKRLILSIAAAALLASPAPAGPLLTQSTQVESIDSERVITEAVVNGRLTDAESIRRPRMSCGSSLIGSTKASIGYVNTHGE
jgi:hypothetical protein